MDSDQPRVVQIRAAAFPKRVSLYETEEGLVLLKALARRRGVSLSDVLRMLIREEAQRVGIVAEQEGVE